MLYETTLRSDEMDLKDRMIMRYKFHFKKEDLIKLYELGIL